MRSCLESLIHARVNDVWSELPAMGSRPDDALIRELAGLVDASHVERTERLRQLVRSLVREHSFVAAGPAPSALGLQPEAQVDALLAAMEAARMDAMRAGVWSREAAAPQMCG
jgi:protein involved in temperature-dependent protein secretion